MKKSFFITLLFAFLLINSSVFSIFKCSTLVEKRIISGDFLLKTGKKKSLIFNYLMAAVCKDGFTKAVLEISNSHGISLGSRALPNVAFVQRIMKEFYHTCKNGLGCSSEKISPSVMILMLIYFDKVLIARGSEVGNFGSVDIQKILLGCFIVAWKYHCDKSDTIFLTDFKKLYCNLFGCNAENCLCFLDEIERRVLLSLEFNAFVSSEIFEEFLTKFRTLALNELVFKKIISLNRENFVEACVKEFYSVLEKNNFCICDISVLREFIYKLESVFEDDSKLYEYLIISFIYFEKMIAKIVANREELETNELLNLLLGCFTIANKEWNRKWDKIKEDFLEKSRNFGFEIPLWRAVCCYLDNKLDISQEELEIFFKKIAFV